ncbi:ATP-binding cassette, subfamily B [Eubacterium oxidoreducens]|uniref:ATP-binding cassette, subfamily B n=1 Tax=Eubacterium oxidoreducens TaxID=1732 RepID=A0A1G6CUM4_EUBOX|nr:ATP-binding cassette, subfamily B [Eubacterium oxidoreducens]
MVVLLLVQAVCDLALPNYTSAIIDTGIQNSGVEHILAERYTAEDYAKTQLFMTEKEKEEFSSVYRLDGEYYVLNTEDDEQLEALDEELLVPIILVYQMSQMDEEQLSAYADLTLDDATLETIRNSAQQTVDSMGSKTAMATGVAYALECDKAAGVDVDAIQKAYLWDIGLRMIIMALIMGVATICVVYVASRIGAGIGRDLRSKVFQNVVKFSNKEIDQFSTASLITRSTNDVQQIQLVSTMLLRMVAYAPILGIGGIIMVVGTGAHMGWVIVLAIVVIMGFVFSLMSIAMPKFKIMQSLVDRVNLVAREILTGLSVIRAFKREDKEEQRFDEANQELKKVTLFTNRVMTFMMPTMMVIMYGLSVLIVWVASHRIDDGIMQVGSMTAFITYSMMIVMSFMILTMLSIMLPRAGVAADRIAEVIAVEPTIDSPAKPARRSEKKGVLRFEDVSFRYPDAPDNVIEHISFTARPGTTSAIVGSTGAGKSALVSLIPRLYDITEGAITLDGVDIRQMDIKELREAIGYVPQKGVLFSGTIASNIRFGNSEADDDRMRLAARIAQAEEFIEEKEERYDSPIAQGGSNVSGGQKQRLSIARAIAKNPEIFVFDDSFSALDLKTDAALRKALHEHVTDKTVVIVAQRISTILHAEQIIVMDEGHIVGQGTHEELLKNCDTYYEIAKSQLSEKELGQVRRKEED